MSQEKVYKQGENLTNNLNWTIYIVNLTSIHGRKYISSIGYQKVIQALNDQVKNDFAPIWGCSGTLIDKTASYDRHVSDAQAKDLETDEPDDTIQSLVKWIVKNEKSGAIDWKKSALIYLIDEHGEDYEGVHSGQGVSALNIPYAIVTVHDNTWPSTLSHEVLELLADPWANRFVNQSKYPVSGWPSQNWFLEVCDACENLYYPAPNGVLVSDFVLPEYFNVTAPFSTPLDFKKKLFRNTADQPVAQFPFPLLKGGYVMYFNSVDDHMGQFTWSSHSSKARNEPETAAARNGKPNKLTSTRWLKYIANHKNRRTAAIAGKRK